MVPFERAPWLARGARSALSGAQCRPPSRASFRGSCSRAPPRGVTGLFDSVSGYTVQPDYSVLLCGVYFSPYIRFCRVLCCSPFIQLKFWSGFGLRQFIRFWCGIRSRVLRGGGVKPGPNSGRGLEGKVLKTFGVAPSLLGRQVSVVCSGFARKRHCGM